jgi:hypothetical protein
MPDVMVKEPIFIEGVFGVESGEIIIENAKKIIDGGKKYNY